VIWFSDMTRRLVKKHEAAKARIERFLGWYHEVKAQREGAPDELARVEIQASLRTIGRAINSAEQRREHVFSALVLSKAADHEAYLATPQGKASQAVCRLMEQQRTQRLEAAINAKLR
jgi:hypothetical protein